MFCGNETTITKGTAPVLNGPLGIVVDTVGCAWCAVHTAFVRHSASAADVDAALEALPNVGAVTVTRSDVT